MAIPSDSAPFIGSRATSAATVAKVGAAASGPPSGAAPPLPAVAPPDPAVFVPPAPPDPWSPAGDDEQPDEHASSAPPTARTAAQRRMILFECRFADMLTLPFFDQVTVDCLKLAGANRLTSLSPRRDRRTPPAPIFRTAGRRPCGVARRRC